MAERDVVKSDPIDVIMAEMAPGDREDAFYIASVILNRSTALGVPPEKVLTSEEFSSIGKPQPPGRTKTDRQMVAEIWADVQRYGPTHNGLYFATPEAAKRLPSGLKEVGRTKGHIFFSDPSNRPIRTAEGVKAPTGPIREMDWSLWTRDQQSFKDARVSSTAIGTAGQVAAARQPTQKERIEAIDVETSFNRSYGPQTTTDPQREVIDAVKAAVGGFFGQEYSVRAVSGTRPGSRKPGHQPHGSTGRGRALDFDIIAPDGTRVEDKSQIDNFLGYLAETHPTASIGHNKNYMGQGRVHFALDNRGQYWGAKGTKRGFFAPGVPNMDPETEAAILAGRARAGQVTAVPTPAPRTSEERKVGPLPSIALARPTQGAGVIALGNVSGQAPLAVSSAARTAALQQGAEAVSLADAGRAAVGARGVQQATAAFPSPTPPAPIPGPREINPHKNFDVAGRPQQRQPVAAPKGPLRGFIDSRSATQTRATVASPQVSGPPRGTPGNMQAEGFGITGTPSIKPAASATAVGRQAQDRRSAIVAVPEQRTPSTFQYPGYPNTTEEALETFRQADKQSLRNLAAREDPTGQRRAQSLELDETGRITRKAGRPFVPEVPYVGSKSATPAPIAADFTRATRAPIGTGPVGYRAAPSVGPGGREVLGPTGVVTRSGFQGTPDLQVSSRGFFDGLGRRGGESSGGGTYLCTLARDLGYLTDDIWKLDAAFGRTVDPVVYAGYSRWAEPLARWLRQESLEARLATFFVIPVVCHWALHMAHMMEPSRKPHWPGRLVHVLGVPVCKLLGARYAENRKLER